MTTTTLIDYHIPEAIQIRVTKVGDFEPPAISLPVLEANSSPVEEVISPSSLIEVGEDVVNAPSANLNHRLSVTFCVDPQLTSLAILQSLIVRAFNLHCDFLLYYDEDGCCGSDGGGDSGEKTLPENQRLLASDDDLNAAFAAYRRPSRPFLSLYLHIIDYSISSISMANLPPNPTSNSKAKKSLNSSNSIAKTTPTSSTSYRNILSDWDVVTSSDVILAQTLSATNTFLAKQIERIKDLTTSTTSSSTLKEGGGNGGSNSSSYWYLAESIYQYIISGGGGGEAERRPDPLDDAAFRAFQDAEGRIGGRARRDLRIAVYRRGVEPSLRRVIWKHLLNVYPEGVTGQERLDYLRLRCQTYRQMRDLWANQVHTDPEVRELLHMVRKDVYRTDRHHPFYANKGGQGKGGGGGSLDQEEENPNVTALLNILITYALNHRTRYCQGMSDLASPLLYVMKDEAHGYVAFCALMSRLAENFSVEGLAMGRKFEHLTALLSHYDPEYFRYLVEAGAHELLFAYRWLLLDLKREFPFEEMLEVLEVIWASIPPASGACYRNLFDEGCLYTPGRQARAEKEAAAKLQQEKKAQEEREAAKAQETPENPNETNRALQRPIKFLPNSSETVLDSPTSDDGEGGGGGGPSKPWDILHSSPDLSAKRRAAYAFEHPTLGTSKCGPTSFDHSQQPETYVFGAFEVEEEEEEVSKEVSCKPRTDSTSKHSQTGGSEMLIADNVSSCSTFDSGIQRSNTLSSVVQGSDESAPSSGKKESRRRRFQALSGLRNAHCNGDDDDEDDDDDDYGDGDGQLSDDDGLEMYHEDEDDHSEDEDDHRHQGRRVFDLSDEFSSTFKTGSVNSTRTLLPREHFSKTEQPSKNNPNRALPLQAGPLLAAKSLLVGHSFSIDSLNNNNNNVSFDKPSEELQSEGTKKIKSPQINVDEHHSISEDKKEDNSSSSDHSSPVNEFEGKEGGKMAKSVSEEMINNLVNNASSSNLEKEMATLNVGTSNGDDLDNLSSSSTSSLVILSKKTPTTTQSQQQQKTTEEKSDDPPRKNQRLLSPEELGPNDAFMLFLCLTMLLQSREHIVSSRMDRNDIQMYFDGLIRKHSVRNVLGDARHLFHTYLSLWHKECLHK